MLLYCVYGRHPEKPVIRWDAFFIIVRLQHRKANLQKVLLDAILPHGHAPRRNSTTFPAVPLASASTCLPQASIAARFSLAKSYR